MLKKVNNIKPKFTDLIIGKQRRKFGYMLEHPRILKYFLFESENLTSADNQQERLELERFLSKKSFYNYGRTYKIC